MKKLELIEGIEARMPIKVHPKTLALYIGRAFNQIFYETFNKDFGNMDIYAKTYKSVPVVFEDDTETWYSVLPVAIIQLPNPGDGVISIHSMKGKGIEFSAQKAGSRDVQRDLEVSFLSGPISWWVMDGRIEYETKGGIDTVETVKMRIIPQFEELKMLDQVHIPAGKDQRLLDLVVEFAQGSPVSKEVNDQTQKTP